MTEKFWQCLLRQRRIVYTGNNLLSYLQSTKLGSTEHRWTTQMATVNVNIKYHSGHSNSDALSWHCVPVLHTVAGSRPGTALPFDSHRDPVVSSSQSGIFLSTLWLISILCSKRVSFCTSYSPKLGWAIGVSIPGIAGISIHYIQYKRSFQNRVHFKNGGQSLHLSPSSYCEVGFLKCWNKMLLVLFHISLL